MRRVWSVPPRMMRLCWWIAIAVAAAAGVGAFLLADRGAISGVHAAMGLAWTVVLAAVGSAFVGTRVARPAGPAREARSVESTLEAASRLIRPGRPDRTPAPGVTPVSRASHHAWRGVRAGGRTVAGVVTVAARSGWAGVRHAAATYRSLRAENRPTGV